MLPGCPKSSYGSCPHPVTTLMTHDPSFTLLVILVLQPTSKRSVIPTPTVRGVVSQILLKETLSYPSQRGSCPGPCAPTQPPSSLHGPPRSTDRIETDAAALPDTGHLPLRVLGSRERLRSYRTYNNYPVTFYSNCNKQHLHREQVVGYFA